MYLYKRTGSTGTTSKYWSVKYRGPDGRYVIKTTRRESKEEARTVGAVWERSARLARAGEFTQATALALFNEVLTATGQTLDAPRISAYFDQWLEGKKVLEKAPATIGRYEAVLDAFKRSLPKTRRDGLLASLTALEVENFRNTEKASGKSATTVNFELKVMRAALNDARRKGLVPANVAEPIALLPEHSAEQRQPFTKDQVRALLSVAETEWTGMVLVGYHCGLRLSDASDLTWDNVDLSSQRLVFRPKKTFRRTGKDTTIALHSDVVEFVEKLPMGDTPGQPLFPSLYARGAGSHAGLSNEFGGLMERAGIKIPLGQRKSGKGRQFRALGFHSLRHSFISRLANAEVGPDVRKELVGHSSSSDEIHRKYTHLDLSLQRKAINQLSSITH